MADNRDLDMLPVVDNEVKAPPSTSAATPKEESDAFMAANGESDARDTKNEVGKPPPLSTDARPSSPPLDLNTNFRILLDPLRVRAVRLIDEWGNEELENPPTPDDLLLAYIREATQPKKRKQDASSGARPTSADSEPPLRAAPSGPTDAAKPWTDALQQLASAQEELRVVSDLVLAIEATSLASGKPAAAEAPKDPKKGGEAAGKQQQQQQQQGSAPPEQAPGQPPESRPQQAAAPAVPFHIGVTALAKLKAPVSESISDVAGRLGGKQALLETVGRRLLSAAAGYRQQVDAQVDFIQGLSRLGANWKLRHTKRPTAASSTAAAPVHATPGYSFSADVTPFLTSLPPTPAAASLAPLLASSHLSSPYKNIPIRHTAQKHREQGEAPATSAVPAAVSPAAAPSHAGGQGSVAVHWQGGRCSQLQVCLESRAGRGASGAQRGRADCRTPGLPAPSSAVSAMQEGAQPGPADLPAGEAAAAAATRAQTEGSQQGQSPQPGPTCPRAAAVPLAAGGYPSPLAAAHAELRRLQLAWLDQQVVAATQGQLDGACGQATGVALLSLAPSSLALALSPSSSLAVSLAHAPQSPPDASAAAALQGVAEGAGAGARQGAAAAEDEQLETGASTGAGIREGGGAAERATVAREEELPGEAARRYLDGFCDAAQVFLRLAFVQSIARAVREGTRAEEGRREEERDLAGVVTFLGPHLEPIPWQEPVGGMRTAVQRGSVWRSGVTAGGSADGRAAGMEAGARRDGSGGGEWLRLLAVSAQHALLRRAALGTLRDMMKNSSRHTAGKEADYGEESYIDNPMPLLEVCVEDGDLVIRGKKSVVSANLLNIKVDKLADGDDFKLPSRVVLPFPHF